MPGHVKLGKAGEADPDPAPYLVVSMEMKREDMKKNSYNKNIKNNNQQSYRDKK